MQSIWFLTISLTLHVTALGYFIAVEARRSLAPIAVTVLPLAPDSEEQRGSLQGGGNGRKPTLVRPGPKPADQRIALQASTEPRAVNGTLEPKSTAFAKVETTVESSVPLPAALLVPSNHETTSHLGFTSHSSIGGGGSGARGLGAGAGSGSGNGAGSGESGKSAALTQARYRDTPRPEYPEHARRQGREGRVLLRVLIDEQGGPKAIEVNRSSGMDALDNAATSAIKRWRFYPARQGDHPVESWVNIPIDFRLTDTKN